jgi:hypothetical protein
VITTNSAPSGANGIILSVGSSFNSGTTAVLNGSLVGNSVTPTLVTQTTETNDFRFVNTASGTGGVTTVSGTSTTETTTYSTIGNIVLQVTGTVNAANVASGTGTFFVPKGTMNIKALDQAQLQSMNKRAGVAVLPIPLRSGSTQYYAVPPPPTYDSSLVVPLPTP